MMLLCLSASRIHNTFSISIRSRKMFLFRRHWIIFPKAKPYILLDTALLINYISRPRMMTWLRENWRLYHIRCEIRSEINGIGNVASYWVSSWDSWLLLSYHSWILRVFLVAKIVRLVMHFCTTWWETKRSEIALYVTCNIFYPY